MRKFLIFVLIFAMTAYLLAPASAQEVEDKMFMQEELLSTDSVPTIKSENILSTTEISTALDESTTDPEGDTETYENEASGNENENHHAPDSSSTGFSTRAVNFPVQIDPGGGTTVNAVLITTINGQLCSANVSYNSSFSIFFGSNTEYNPDIAVISSLLSANAYESNYLDYNNMNVTASNSMEVWMNLNSMEDFVCYDLNSYESDHHVSKMYIGHKFLTMNGMTRDIVCVVIRGTNGEEEWQSNFDIGTTAESPRHNDWTNINNHKGFDITANRLNDLLDEYVAQYCSSLYSVFWITGHSRGGALANLLAAKKVDEGKTVYGYTFASPNTTTLSTAQTATKYQCIFNIVNEDDYVTKLPMSGWEFRRYGVDKTASIDEEYESDWEALTNCTGNILEGYGGDYNNDRNGMNGVLEALTGIANNRNDCYVERAGTNGYTMHYELTSSKRDEARETMLAYYDTLNMDGTYRVSNGYTDGSYYYRVYQKPTFLMQLLAAYMGKIMTEEEFVAIDVAPYLEAAKWGIASAGLSGMVHPHIVESYYLLATKLT